MEHCSLSYHLKRNWARHSRYEISNLASLSSFEVSLTLRFFISLFAKTWKTISIILNFFYPISLQDCRRSKGGELTKEECREIIGKMITLERFSVGQGAIDILLYLFGIPICALMAKRIIPGMKSISDDVVIPIATSGSVIFLAKTNKL